MPFPWSDINGKFEPWIPPTLHFFDEAGHEVFKCEGDITTSVPTHKWITKGDTLICGGCCAEYDSVVLKYICGGTPAYCPKCGSKMEGG